MRKRIGRLLLATAAVSALLVWPPAQSALADEDCGQPGAVEVPNRYDQPFCVRDDQLFVFAASYKPFEYSATEQRQSTRVFDAVIGDALRAAFPDVDIKYATWDFPVRYEDLQRAGVVPDIVIDNPRNRIDRDLEPLGWVGDLTAMIEQGGLDLSQLNQAAVEQVRSRSDGGIYGVPIFVDDYLLYYNKMVFDRFGVRYPEAGTTYDEIYRLAKRLTRQEGLDAYKGFMAHPDTYLELNQLGVYPFQQTDSEEPAPEDVTVDLTSAEWTRLGENMERLLTIRRNIFTTVGDFMKADMSKAGHLAMAVDTVQKLPMYALNEMFIDDGDEEDLAEHARSVDLGVTSVPVFGNGSEATYQPNTLAAFIPPQSDQKEQAFEIVKWLVSEQAQVQLSRWAMKGVLETDAVVESFGDAIPELADVDTSAVYWGENAVVRDYQNTEYWDIPLYRVFRQHVLIDGMTVGSSLIVTEREDIPAYIQSRAEAGYDW